MVNMYIYIYMHAYVYCPLPIACSPLHHCSHRLMIKDLDSAVEQTVTLNAQHGLSLQKHQALANHPKKGDHRGIRRAI